jgi:hypothetical protein
LYRRRRRGWGDRFWSLFAVVEPGNDSEREPLAHALLPKQGVLVDHLQPEEVVDLFQRQNLFFTRRDADSPKVVAAHGQRF